MNLDPDERKTSHVAFFTIILILFSLVVPTVRFLNTSAQVEPSYSAVGSYAIYQVLGGFIPFFDGVNGTISYTVTNVFSNNSMSVSLNGNVSQGNEAPTSNVTYNFNDNILDPRIFPALAPNLLTERHLIFENISCNFVQNSSLAVPAGTFETMEFTGNDKNGALTYYWFDPSSGLVIEMAQGGGAFQLQQSNIATPSSISSGFSTSLPFFETFGLAFGIGAALFFGIHRYYNRKSSRVRSQESSQGAVSGGKPKKTQWPSKK